MHFSRPDEVFTAAYAQVMGKSENCAEVVTMRRFRDEYVKATPEGCKLMEQYSKIAPEIIEKINASNRKRFYYNHITEVIVKCVKLIGVCEYKQAFIEYKCMILELIKEFNLN